MENFVQVITTTSSREQAQQIAQVLVVRQLAACVQVFGPIESVYRWQGKVETSQEWYCAVKTRQSLFEEVARAIRQEHSYEVPEIIALPITAGSESYLQWVAEQTRPDA